MKGCNGQEHQSYQSIYCMLNLNETASEAELMHAYDEEMALLEKMQPNSEAEQKLLEAKRQELIEAMERAQEETLSQRVQTQYQKRKVHAQQLNSFFPVGILGLILRLFNISCGTGGWCDSCFAGCFGKLDRGCCSCSCCPDGECCLGDLYGCIVSEGVCSCPSSCAGWYENARVVRLIDMGLVIAVAIGAAIFYIKASIESAARKARRAKLLAGASTDLREMKQMLKEREEMVSVFLAMYDQLSIFSLDVRPFVRFMAKRPEADRRFVEMAESLDGPGSFYNKVRQELGKMAELHRKISAIDSDVVRIANAIQRNETYQELDGKEHCSNYVNDALNGLRQNYRYQAAVDFIQKNK